MPCYHPLKGYRSRTVAPSGKRSIVFSQREAFDDRGITIPCGQCVGCRLERSRQWAIRCTHEASLYEQNCFITLTYAPEHLPPGGTLVYRHFQLFMKRLRKRFGEQIRFYMCGEYGEKYRRPHYHACVFNFDFSDKVIWRVSNEQRLYTSAILAELWPFGFSSVGTVTFESAAYVARYIMKKVTGNAAEDHYRVIDPETGEIFDRVPEFTNMSRRGGIGRSWLEQFVGDVYPDDFVVLRGAKMRPPKYYDSMYEVIDPFGYDDVKFAREDRGQNFVDNNTPERLRVREKVQVARLQLLPRVLD